MTIEENDLEDETDESNVGDDYYGYRILLLIGSALRIGVFIEWTYGHQSLNLLWSIQGTNLEVELTKSHVRLSG